MHQPLARHPRAPRGARAGQRTHPAATAATHLHCGAGLFLLLLNEGYNIRGPTPPATVIQQLLVVEGHVPTDLAQLPLEGVQQLQLLQALLLLLGCVGWVRGCPQVVQVPDGCVAVLGHIISPPAPGLEHGDEPQEGRELVSVDIQAQQLPWLHAEAVAKAQEAHGVAFNIGP